MSEEKKSDFVVSDRRLFTDSGELRKDVPREERSEAAAPPAPAHVEAQKFTTEEVRGETPPPPPTEAEQQEQHENYRTGSRQLDDLLRERSLHAGVPMEMSFERLVASLYMTAMLQLGLMAPEGEQPRVDILGARQSIDTLGVLQEKTKGNLTPAEQNLLQQSLFELRMAFVEMTNAIARAPLPSVKPAGGAQK